jgi:hypothetical protein
MNADEMDSLLPSTRNELKRVTAERDALNNHLGNLLAVIHRDGGHYQGDNGTDQAVSDGMQIVSSLIAERDALSLECDRWQYAHDKVKEMVTLEELKNKQLKADIYDTKRERDDLMAANVLISQQNERLRAALEQYAAPGNWDSRGGWMNCFFNIGDEGPDIAREALEPKP